MTSYIMLWFLSDLELCFADFRHTESMLIPVLNRNWTMSQTLLQYTAHTPQELPEQPPGLPRKYLVAMCGTFGMPVLLRIFHKSSQA